MSFAASAPFCGRKNGKNEQQRIRPKQIPVGTDERMQRKTHQVEDDAAQQSNHAKQQHIEPVRNAVSTPIEHCQRNARKQQCSTNSRWRKRRWRAFYRFGRQVDECAVLRYQRHNGVGGGLNPCFGKFVAQIERKPDCAFVACWLVGLGTKHKRNAKRRPVVPADAVVHNVAIGGFARRIGAERGFVNGVQHHVVGACGAVVEHKIVAIKAIFGLVVFDQRIEKPLPLRQSQVQHLLLDTRAALLVGAHKRMGRAEPDFVVGGAFHKFRNEQLLLEVEHAVVKHQIDVECGVAHTQCRVAKFFVNSVARGASDEADLALFGELRRCNAATKE